MFASYIVGAAHAARAGQERERRARGNSSAGTLRANLATLKERLGFEPRDVDDVIAGCVSQVGEQGANVARNAVLAAGWPYEVSAVSLNRQRRRDRAWPSAGRRPAQCCSALPWTNLNGAANTRRS